MLFFLHKILLLLPPEVAHHWAIFLLKLYQKFIILFLETKKSSSAALHLKEVRKIRFGNRLGLAAGFDKNAEVFLPLSHLGFGFIEVGTVTPNSQEGNPKPRIWRESPDGLINQMGFNNCGVEQFKKNLKKNRLHCSVPILANIGKNKITPNELAIQDYKSLFSMLAPEVDGFVVNISSPNTVGLRELQSIAFLEHLEEVAPQKPLWVKLSPDLDMDVLKELFLKIKSSQCFLGCVLTNTSRQIALQEYGRAEGGYSGEKLFERSLECVALCREIFNEKKSIIAVGGINSVVRAKKMRQEGADLIELYTGFVYKGPALVKEIVKGLADESFELSF